MVWYVSSPGAWLVATSTVNRFPAEYTIIPAVARDRLVNIPAQLAKGRHVLHRINAMQSESPLYLRKTEMSSTCSLPMEEMCSCKLQRYDSRLLYERLAPTDGSALLDGGTRGVLVFLCYSGNMPVTVCLVLDIL